jgi:hypothetical protein
VGAITHTGPRKTRQRDHGQAGALSSLRSGQEAALSWCPDRRGEAGETSTLRACDDECLLVRPSMVDLCPPCSVCEGVNAVATFVDQLALLPGLAGEVDASAAPFAEPCRCPASVPGDRTPGRVLFLVVRHD